MAVISLNFINKAKLIMSVSGLGTCLQEKLIIKKLFLLIYKLILKTFLSKINYNIIFQNRDDYHQLSSLIRIQSKNVKFVSGSGIDTEYLIPSKLISKKTNILMPARILYEKGVNEYIEAIQILKKI